MTDTSGTDPMVQSFFWGDATQGLTLDQLKARRAVAAAMASKARPYPTTVGMGLTALGEGLGQGLYERNLGIAEARQRALDVQELQRSKAPTEARPPAGASSGAAGSADAAATGAFGLGSPSTNVASEDSGPPAPVGTDALAGSVLAQQGVLPGSAPMQRTRMAALDTGTVSDAGSPGLTYGGVPAGPGASMMEPPTTAPPAPTAPSVAANAAAQQPAGPAGTPVPGVVGGGQGSGGPAGPPAPVGADAVAGSVLAQIGAGAPVPRPPPMPPPDARGDIRIRPTNPSTAPQQQPGQTYAPPTTRLPQPDQPMPGTAYPGPGEVRLEPPARPENLRPPPVRQDTPAMIQNRAVRNDPRMLGRRSESVLQQMDQEFLKMKEDRDKAFERATEQWQADRARITEQEKQYKSDVQTYPQRLDEATKRQMELVRRQRFGPAADEIDKTTIASAAKVEPMTQTLRMIPELNGMVDKMFSGQFAGDKLAVMKTLNAADKALLGPFFGNRGYFNDEIQATEAFKSAISSIVATTLKGISGSSGITEGERAYAEKAAAGDISMEPESIKRVLGIIQRAGINNIRDHNDRMDKVYDDPKRNDVAMHRMYKVDLPPEAFDPTDIMNLQATPNSPEERARFDRIYGNGSARRITGFGR